MQKLFTVLQRTHVMSKEMIKENTSFTPQLQTAACYRHDARLTGVTAKQVVSSLSHDDRLSLREASFQMSSIGLVAAQLG